MVVPRISYQLTKGVSPMAVYVQSREFHCGSVLRWRSAESKGSVLWHPLHILKRFVLTVKRHETAGHFEVFGRYFCTHRFSLVSRFKSFTVKLERVITMKGIRYLKEFWQEWGESEEKLSLPHSAERQRQVVRMASNGPTMCRWHQIWEKEWFHMWKRYHLLII